VRSEKAESIKRKMAGFTLLEVMVAIFIFGIVMTTIFGSFHAIFSHAGAIRDGAETYENARTCLDRIMADLEAIYFVPEYEPRELNTKDPYRVEGKKEQLRFTSRAHVGLEDDDDVPKIAEIVYYLDNDKDGYYTLKRADNLEPFHEPFEKKAGDPILCEKLRSLTFLYYDEEGKEHDHWESGSDSFKYATPKAIRIKLEIANESSSLFFETMTAFPFFRPEKS